MANQKDLENAIRALSMDAVQLAAWQILLKFSGQNT